jgi:hypothetical protein
MGRNSVVSGKKCARAKLNSGRWDFRVSGMKFDNVAQWVLPIVWSEKSHLIKV